MITRINLMFAASLLACTTAGAQVGVDFRSAIEQTRRATIAVKLDSDSPPGSTRFRWRQELRAPHPLPKEFMPHAWWHEPQAARLMRSGFAVAEDLVISCRVPEGEVDLVSGDGRELKGRVVLRDHVTGLAAIRVDDASLNSLAVATEAPQAGLPVLISWLQGGKTLTSQASMIASQPHSNQSQLGFTQSLDIDFTPEKIGAPIVDAGGNLVGVLVSKEGDILCLSTEHVARLTEAASAENPKDLYRGRMGIRLGEQQGALIEEVMDETPAEKAELAAGDKVTKVADRQCNTMMDLMAALSMLRAGDEVTLEIRRGEETFERTLELASAGPDPKLSDPYDAPKVSQQFYQLKDGKLVPVDKDVPVIELDIRSPLRGLRLGNLQVERTELEQSLKKLEMEKKQQDELIKILEEKLAQMRLEESKTRMELEVLLKRLDDQAAANSEARNTDSGKQPDSQDSQDESSPR